MSDFCPKFPWSQIADGFSIQCTDPRTTGAVNGTASEKTHWIGTEQIFQIKFLSNKVTIFSFSFKAQQPIITILVLHDLTLILKLREGHNAPFPWQDKG